MREERRIFEERIREYKDRAQKALDIVNNMNDLFNSYGSPFTVYDKSTLSQKCKEGFVEEAVESILSKANSGGVKKDKLYRIEHRCSLMVKILTEPARRTKAALKAYGRVMLYDSERLRFFLDRDKLESYAMRYAEDLD